MVSAIFSSDNCLKSAWYKGSLQKYWGELVPTHLSKQAGCFSDICLVKFTCTGTHVHLGSSFCEDHSQYFLLKFRHIKAFPYLKLEWIVIGSIKQNQTDKLNYIGDPWSRSLTFVKKPTVAQIRLMLWCGVMRGGGGRRVLIPSYGTIKISPYCTMYLMWYLYISP